jgi:hypothetical protein
LKRLRASRAPLAALLVLAGCDAGTPLPTAPAALEAALTARGLALPRTLPTLSLEGRLTVAAPGEPKQEAHWKLLAVRGERVELTVSSPLFNETVARVTVTPDTLRVWLKPPGKRNARLYAGPRRSLPVLLGAQPWARDSVNELTGWLEAWLTTPAPSPPAPRVTGTQETDDALTLDFQRELGTARLRLRRRDGFPLLLEARPAKDASLGCLSLSFSPEKPFTLGPSALLLPRELQGEVRSCCTGTVELSWRLRVQRVGTEVEPVASPDKEAPPPGALVELTQHEWFRRAGPLLGTHRAQLACPATGPRATPEGREGQEQDRPP